VDNSIEDSGQARVLSVSQVSRYIKATLEDSFPKIYVRGEVSGYSKAQSGHAYFSLIEREPSGQTMKLDCVLYRFSRASSKVLRNGDVVIASGRVTSWGGASRYQLVVEGIEDAGEGDLLKKLQQLKDKLLAEGLFDPAKKKPLPFLPRKVGVVTSLRGAALRDIVRTLWLRYPVSVLVADTLVQGDGAAEGIAKQIAALDARPDVDVIIVGRGGGSIEDLWAFNEEIVVRAVAACRTPIVSAVGHEVDHVLSDEAADVRAATPTAAAQLVVPDIAMLHKGLGDTGERLGTLMTRVLEGAYQSSDEMAMRLGVVGGRVFRNQEHRLEILGHRLAAVHPARVLAGEERRLSMIDERLKGAGNRLLTPFLRRLEAADLRLRPCNPLGPLSRGYALARTRTGRVINRFDQVEAGADIQVLLGTGSLNCTVDSTSEGPHEVGS